MEGQEPIPVLASGTYRHYKGGVYRVLGAARHSEDGTHFAVYEPLPPTPYAPGLRVRPLEMFCEQVEHDGRAVARFQRLAEAPGEDGRG